MEPKDELYFEASLDKRLTGEPLGPFEVRGSGSVRDQIGHWRGFGQGRQKETVWRDPRTLRAASRGSRARDRAGVAVAASPRTAVRK